ncbi:DUF4395 domain-containing protein [Pontimicrobium sp. SW4]|uniref:DUF4395 domain-containing protein n=1 Tax=Pontimicrobium sp. SW4 TaxID=3153519 RepID=A0AAU7BNN4_9FLAO
MSRIKQFGEKVEGYNIPVLNEREIRASAGIIFLFMFIAIILAGFSGKFLMLKYMITIFLTEMIIRVFINPKFAPLLIIGRLITNKQKPIYVGAPQKKFAWIIGIIFSATIAFFTIGLNTFHPVATGLVCLICLIFLYFETAFNVCLGCKIYGLFYREKAQYCPGEICDINSREDIQKTSKAQFIIVLGLIAYILLIIFLFNEFYSKKPIYLMKFIDSL